MINQEFGPRQNDKDGDLLEIYFHFTGKDYCEGGSQAEIKTAKDTLIKQHNKVKPKLIREMLHKLSQNDSLIQTEALIFQRELSEDNLANALGTLNKLYVYGNTVYMDSLGGRAFQVSLEAHRIFAKKISGFIEKDPFLAPDRLDMLGKIDHYRDQLEPEKELNMLRQIIHSTALHGTLGEPAKQQFDPFAIPAVKQTILSLNA